MFVEPACSLDRDLRPCLELLTPADELFDSHALIGTFSLPSDIQFGSKELSHRRRYTRWFHGASPAVDMTSYAIANWRRWRREIKQWQNPVLQDPGLPDWFKSALFNELYFIAGGCHS